MIRYHSCCQALAGNVPDLCLSSSSLIPQLLIPRQPRSRGGPNRREPKDHREHSCLRSMNTILESITGLRKFSGGPWLSKMGICSRQDAKNAKSGSLISLRSLHLCARYSEFLVCGFAALGFLRLAPQSLRRFSVPLTR
jgi:hypothetical protein